VQQILCQQSSGRDYELPCRVFLGIDRGHGVDAVKRLGSVRMAKAALESSSGAGVVLKPMSEAERQAALAKVRAAFEALSSERDPTEASQKRINLLQIWHELVNMREPVAEGDGPAADPLGMAPTPIAATDIVIESVEATDSASNPRSPLPDTDQNSASAARTLDYPDFTPSAEPHDHVTEEATDSQPSVFLAGVPPERMRLRLVRPGIIFDTILPKGTIVAVLPADAHDILETGIAEIVLEPEPPDDLPS
jgi:hypothetical protein